jgi:mannose/fructose/N-acetylgalactosamine-specific phosphotransferase system component IIC
MSPELAVTMAIPFGLLGTTVVNVFKMIMSYFNHVADRAAAEGNAKKIRKLAYLYPPLVWLPLAVIPVTLIVYLGPDAVKAVLERIPESVLHGLAVAGGMLPALGFTMTVRTIGRKNLLPFFFAGFFLIQYSGLSTIAAAIFGTILAVIYIQLKRGENYAS